MPSQCGAVTIGALAIPLEDSYPQAILKFPCLSSLDYRACHRLSLPSITIELEGPVCSPSSKPEVHLDVKKISNSFHATLDTTTLVRSVKTKRLLTKKKPFSATLLLTGHPPLFLTTNTLALFYSPLVPNILNLFKSTKFIQSALDHQTTQFTEKGFNPQYF